MCKNCNQNFPFADMRDLDRIIEEEHSASEDMRLFIRSLNDLDSQNSSRKGKQESDPVIDCKYIDIECPGRQAGTPLFTNTYNLSLQ